MSLKPIICCKEYTITAFSAVNNDELRDVVKCGTSSIFAETLDKTLACTYKVYGDNYVHVEFADNVISYVYDQYDGWSVRGVSREDSVSVLKALYVKLGGDYDDVVGCVTDLEVLNRISVLYNGEDGARSYTEAIKNIADVIEPIREKTVSIPVYRLKLDRFGDPIGSPELLRTVTKTVGEYAKVSDFIDRTDIPTNCELFDKSWAESESFSSIIRRFDIPYNEYSRVLVSPIPQTITDADDETRSITIDCFLFRIVSIGQ